MFFGETEMTYIIFIPDFSFCKEVQYHNTPVENPIPVVLCPDKKEHWYRIGKVDMSNVWNKVDENQQSNVFDMITPQQLQILAGLQYKYRKVALIYNIHS